MLNFFTLVLLLLISYLSDIEQWISFGLLPYTWSKGLSQNTFFGHGITDWDNVFAFKQPSVAHLKKYIGKLNNFVYIFL